VPSATIVGAELLGRAGEVGGIAGALVDLLGVDGNPLKDLGVFQDEGGAHIPVVMQGGRLHRNRLGAG
jgi:imidazolonepropionase-like amidohydrolase